MNTSGIRVRQLALRVPDRACVRPFANDLEDALRTASWPQLPGGARLHVRRLRLGRLPRGLSRQALAALLTRRLADTETLILRWPAPAMAAVDGAVVLLPDTVQAAAYALRAALAGQGPHWAVAETFPGLNWHVPQQAAPEVLTRLIALHGPAAPSRLIALPGVLPLVLRTLTLAPAATLAAWLAPLRAALPEPLRSTLALTAENPVTLTATDATAFPPGSPARPVSASVKTLAAYLRPIATAALAHWPAHAPQTCLLLAWNAAAHSGPQAAAPVLRRWLAVPAELSTHAARPDLKSPTLLPPTDPDRPSTTGLTAPETPRSQTNTPDAEPALQRLSTLADHPDFAGELSRHAGLWLLLPLLHHLNAPEAEAALGTPLCAPILTAFADRLGLGKSDPSRAALADDPDTPPEMQHHPYAPSLAVLRTLAGPHPLRLRHTTPARASLGLWRGPSGLACLDATTLHALRKQRVRFAATPPARVTDVTLGLMLAAQVLAHRLTGQGWRGLCQRTGRVTVSNTHIDVTFDGRDADPAVRIAGLDTDPGWVPWLGRVVSFHYDYSALQDWGQAEHPNER